MMRHLALALPALLLTHGAEAVVRRLPGGVSPVSVAGATATAVSGTAPAASLVTVLRGGTALGTATANASGQWTYTPSTAPANGNVFTASAAVTSAPFTVSGLVVPVLSLAPASNRNQIAAGALTASTYQSSATRKRTGRVPVSGVVLRFPWYFVDANSTETLIGNGATATASIEYPTGTFTQAIDPTSGTPTLTITDGSNLDMTCPVNLPANTFFCVHVHLTLSGTKHPINVILSATTSDRYDNVATDKTMTGGEPTVDSPAPGGSNSFSPLVLGYIPATEPSYVGVGDSIMAGSTENGGAVYAAAVDSYGNVGWYERWINQAGFNLLNLARGSTTAAGWAATGAMTRRLDTIRGLTNSIGINALGHNDIGYGVSTMQSNVGIVNGRLNAILKKTAVCTLTPYTASSDNFATQSGQTVSSPDNASYNALVLAGSVPGQTGSVDVLTALYAGGANGTDPNKWPTNGTQRYYTPEGVHPLTPSSILIATNLPAPAGF